MVVLAGHQLRVRPVSAMASRPQQQQPVQSDQLSAQRSGQSATKGVVAAPGDALRAPRCGARRGLLCLQLALQTQQETLRDFRCSEKPIIRPKDEGNMLARILSQHHLGYSCATVKVLLLFFFLILPSGHSSGEIPNSSPCNKKLGRFCVAPSECATLKGSIQALPFVHCSPFI